MCVLLISALRSRFLSWWAPIHVGITQPFCLSRSTIGCSACVDSLTSTIRQETAMRQYDFPPRQSRLFTPSNTMRSSLHPISCRKVKEGLNIVAQCPSTSIPSPPAPMQPIGIARRRGWTCLSEGIEAFVALFLFLRTRLTSSFRLTHVSWNPKTETQCCEAGRTGSALVLLTEATASVFGSSLCPVIFPV